MTWIRERVFILELLGYDYAAILRGETRNLGHGFGDARFFAFRTDGETFSVDEFHVGHAEEAQEVAHVARLRTHRRTGIEAAARREHVNFLAGEQTHGALLAVLESHSGAGNMIEVGLQWRRHAEIVHRQPDHNDVRLLQ